MKDDGGKAFPVSQKIMDDDTYDYIYVTAGGMTLRDYFAAQVLGTVTLNDDVLNPVVQRNVAQAAYALADAMLIERAK